MTDHHAPSPVPHPSDPPEDQPVPFGQPAPDGQPAPFGRPFPDEGPTVLDRRQGPFGEVVLRRHGELLQIIANGSFLMDTSDGRSERRLVRDALEAVLRPPATGQRPGPGSAPAVLIGGLGVGFSLAEAAADPRWGSITVVEREPAVLDWHRDGAPLASLTAAARADPRTSLLREELHEHLRNTSFRYDALCLDVDNGPEWTVTEENDSLYTPAGLAALHARLTPGGILGVWSARPSATFGAALVDAGFREVRSEEVPVFRGEPDVIHLARRMP